MATDDALAVLAAALDRSKEGPQTGPDVRLALQSLQFVGVPRDAIRYFWDGASGANEIARSQSMNAALNRIRLEIKRKHQRGETAMKAVWPPADLARLRRHMSFGQP